MADAEKERARLAAKLRDNLKKRKVQARVRASVDRENQTQSDKANAKPS